jgi:hypothetical protein
MVQRCTISADPLLADRLLRRLNDSLREPRSGPHDAPAGRPPRAATGQSLTAYLRDFGHQLVTGTAP